MLLQYLESIHPMTDGCKERLSSVLRLKELQKKELLLRAGHVCQHIYFIQRGLLRCFYQKNDVEICSWFMK
jgi:CRP-like cAMP-binding protein